MKNTLLIYRAQARKTEIDPMLDLYKEDNIVLLVEDVIQKNIIEYLTRDYPIRQIFPSTFTLKTNKELLNGELDNMRFHNIGGNPPYEDGTQEGGNNKIYNQISKKVLSLLTKDGVLGPWYTPISVIKKSKRFSFIGEKGLKEVDFTVNDDFDSGVIICATTLDRTYEGDVKVIDSSGNVSYVERNKLIYDYGKGTVDKQFTMLYEKLKSITDSPDKRMFKRNDFGTPTRSKTRTFEYKYSFKKLNKGKPIHSYYSNRAPFFENENKFTIGMTKAFNQLSIHTGKLNFDLNNLCIGVNDDSEIDNIKSFIFSDYFKKHSEMWKVVDGYGFNCSLMYLPPFDKTKHWTNEEVKEFIERFLND